MVGKFHIVGEVSKTDELVEKFVWNARVISQDLEKLSGRRVAVRVPGRGAKGTSKGGTKGSLECYRCGREGHRRATVTGAPIRMGAPLGRRLLDDRHLETEERTAWKKAQHQKPPRWS